MEEIDRNARARYNFCDPAAQFIQEDYRRSKPPDQFSIPDSSSDLYLTCDQVQNENEKYTHSLSPNSDDDKFNQL